MHLKSSHEIEKLNRHFILEADIVYPPNAIDSESIKPLSVLHSGLKREW